MSCKFEYEIRKPLLLRALIRNSFTVRESELHESVLNELQQIADYYSISGISNLIQSKKIFYSHSVYLLDEIKFMSFTYSDECYNHFKFQDGKMTDYYEERTPHMFNDNQTWKQWNPKTKELEHIYTMKNNVEIKKDLQGNIVGQLLLDADMPFDSIYEKIKKSGISRDEFHARAWGVKDYGEVVEFFPRDSYQSFTTRKIKCMNTDVK